MKSEYSTDPAIKAIAKKAFPAYRGRKISVEYGTSLYLDPYPDGGSWSDYVAIDRATGNVAPYRASNPFRDGNAYKSHEIPPNMIIVEHSRFCGKDTGLTVYLPKMGALPLDASS